MKGFNKFLFGNLLVMGLISSAYADMPNPFGWYVEGNLGKSYVSSIGQQNVNIKNTGRAFSVDGGYKFNHYFAAEVGYTNYALVRFRNPSPTTIADDNVWSADFAGKGILPIWQTGFDVFAKVGVGYINSYVSLTNPAAASLFNINVNTGLHTATNIYMGGGLEYAMTKSLIANIQWEKQRGSHYTGNGELASAGLAWIF